jgi:hypothetical protein
VDLESPAGPCWEAANCGHAAQRHLPLLEVLLKLRVVLMVLAVLRVLGVVVAALLPLLLLIYSHLLLLLLLLLLWALPVPGLPQQHSLLLPSKLHKPPPLSCGSQGSPANLGSAGARSALPPGLWEPPLLPPLLPRLPSAAAAAAAGKSRRATGQLMMPLVAAVVGRLKPWPSWPWPAC